MCGVTFSSNNNLFCGHTFLMQIFFGNKSSSISKAETEKRADPSVEDENDIKKNKMRMKYDVYLPNLGCDGAVGGEALCEGAGKTSLG